MDKTIFDLDNTLSTEDFYKFFKQNILKSMEKVSPAKIIDYDASTNRANCQILIQNLTYSNELIDPAVIYNIPVFKLGCGGVYISFPIKNGDLGWIITTDKDMSIFKKNMQKSPQNTDLRHKYNSSFFIPDRITTNNSQDADYMVIIADDNNTKISIKSGTIKINSAETINIEGQNINIEGQTINIKGQNINLQGQLSIQGQLLMNGKAGYNGSYVNRATGQTIEFDNGIAYSVT